MEGGEGEDDPPEGDGVGGEGGEEKEAQPEKSKSVGAPAEEEGEEDPRPAESGEERRKRPEAVGEKRPEQVVLLPGVATAIARLRAGWRWTNGEEERRW